MIERVAINVVQEAVHHGVRDFCICPGARNTPLISILKHEPSLKCHYFYDERSAAFFALGRSQETGKPAAVLTTSGTAIAHLLAPAMEGYYTRTPLLLITADRPRSYRGCNAPQSAEQPGLYGQYTPFAIDLAGEDPCDLSGWDRKTPAHINICLEEPPRNAQSTCQNLDITEKTFPQQQIDLNPMQARLDTFLSGSRNLFVVVGSLKAHDRDSVAEFLLRLNAPVFLEGISGLREDPRLHPLAITRTEKLWDHAANTGYPIDSILRIGGVPTFRLWRDLEDKKGKASVFSLNDAPFSGLSWGPIECAPIGAFLNGYHPPRQYPHAKGWKDADVLYQEKLAELFRQEPRAEPSLVHALSSVIPSTALVYLGNSLPIREWDLAASRTTCHSHVRATRGLNGIDGQTSIFAAMCSPLIDNWALLGDLTALYDLSGPWIFSQLPGIRATIVVINNSGGKIFARMFADKEIQNEHEHSFKPVADLWKLDYALWETIPEDISAPSVRLVEIIPDNDASHRFWQKLGGI